MEATMIEWFFATLRQYPEIAIFLTLLIRVLAVRFNWTTRAFGRWHARGKDDADKGSR